MKNNNDLTARQLLRVIEHEIYQRQNAEAEDLALYFERTYIGQYSNADTGTDALRPLHLI